MAFRVHSLRRCGSERVSAELPCQLQRPILELSIDGLLPFQRAWATLRKCAVTIVIFQPGSDLWDAPGVLASPRRTSLKGAMKDGGSNEVVNGRGPGLGSDDR